MSTINTSDSPSTTGPLKRRTPRCRWMAGAAAASAAASAGAQAKVVQITLLDNSTGGIGRGFHLGLNADLTGDGVADLKITSTASSTDFGLPRARAHLNNFFFSVSNSFGGIRETNLHFVGPKSHLHFSFSRSSAPASFTGQEYFRIPVTFTDSKYNGGAATHGFLEGYLQGDLGDANIFLDRLIFDDANPALPNLRGVVLYKFYNTKPAPDYPVVATVTNGDDPARDVPYDIDKNGSPDLVLYNPATRRSEVALLNNSSYLKTVDGPVLPSGTQLVGVADFNKDGKPDYLVMDTSTRALSVMFLIGTKYYTTENITDKNATPVALPASFQIVALADMNADGVPDLVLFNPTSRFVYFWFFKEVDRSLADRPDAQIIFDRGIYLTQAGKTVAIPAGWQVVGVGDFNGDKQQDVLFFNPGNLQTMVWYLNKTAYAGQAAGPTISAGSALIGTADFDGNGKPDFLLFDTERRPGIWYLNGVTYAGGKYVRGADTNPIVLPAGFNIVAP